MKLSKQGRLYTLQTVVDKWMQPRIDTLKAEAKAIGEQVHTLYIKDKVASIEKTVKDGLIPANWMGWHEKTDVRVCQEGLVVGKQKQAAGKSWNLETLVENRYGTYNYRAITGVDEEAGIGRTCSKVFDMSSHFKIPCPRHPQSYQGADVPVVTDEPTISRIVQFINDIYQLDQEVKAFAKEVRSVLISTSTFKQLEEYAPELAKTYPTPPPKQHQVVPVELLNDVNKKLAQMGGAGAK